LEADSTFFLGRPGPRRIIWRFVADANTAVTQLVAGEADVLNFLGGPDNVERVERTEHLAVVEYPSSVYYYVAFNFRDPANLSQPHPLFGDREVRRAITMAADRATIVQAVLGQRGFVPRGPISPALWIWTDQLPELPFDSTAARRILARRGWADADGDGALDRRGQPFEFELLVPVSSAPRRQAAQILQEQLRRIGVTVRLTELEFNAFLNQAAERQFDAVFGAYGGEISPASVGEVWGSAAVESFNWGNYANATVDGLIRRAMNATDVASATRAWNSALTGIIDDAPAIWMFTPVTTAGVHVRFENVSLRPDQWATTLWQWRVPPNRYHERDRFAR
jgi:peptide/nickel transport system substrate-binding protein